MKSKLISAFGVVVFLHCTDALCNDNPAREFNPKFELAYFEPADSDLEGSVGFKYELFYSIKLNDPLAESTDRPQIIDKRVDFFNFNLYSKGNVPFKEDFPIEDFIETGFDLGGQSSHLKVLDRCADGECSNNLKDDAFIVKYSASYQFEADRDFDSKQHAYGGKLRLVYKKYDNSILQYFNPLEWIPSVIKAVVGDELRVSGDKKLYAPKPFDEPYLPSLFIAVEEVDPEKDETRKVVEPDLEKYERARVELAYSSTLFKISDDNIYRASFIFRHFQEISPEKAIKDAELDSFTYRTFAIHTPGDIVISYSKGQLPFDVKSEAMFKIGWEQHF